MFSFSARMTPSTIFIRRTDGSEFRVTLMKTDRVYTLKEKISSELGLTPEQQSLVYRAKVLADDLSLSYYGIHDGSIVFLVPKKSARQSRPLPSQLVSRLFALLDSLPEVSSTQYQITVNEINELLKNPILKSASRINPEIQQILDDAEQTVKNSERPLSEKTIQFVAKNQDIAMAQFEASPDGYRILQSVMEEEQIEDEGTIPEYTNIQYPKRLNDRPLPNCWKKDSVFQMAAKNISNYQYSTPTYIDYHQQQYHYSWENQIGNYPYQYGKKDGSTSRLKEKFATQLKLLKNMGFSDEEGILQALSESDGNVQKAVFILRSRPRSEC